MEGLTVSQPLYQQVYEGIKRSILKGDFQPGEKVVAAKLAEKYKISRTPLREALRQLEIEGLLVQGRLGLHVVKLDSEDFQELYECRLILETEIIKMAVDKITDKQLGEMNDLLNKADQVLEKRGYLQLLELNTIFHEKIFEASPNKRIVNLVQQVRTFLLIYRANILRDYQRNYDINWEHRKIYEALVERNRSKAVKTIEMHIKNDLIRGLGIIME